MFAVAQHNYIKRTQRLGCSCIVVAIDRTYFCWSMSILENERNDKLEFRKYFVYNEKDMFHVLFDLLASA